MMEKLASWDTWNKNNLSRTSCVSQEKKVQSVKRHHLAINDANLYPKDP